jgi:PHD/YefM family antitoxin component YafN of YafNO toxin-antitoxin module
MAKVFQKPIEIVTRDGKPVRVILDIDDFEDLLERLEDAYDLEELEELKKKPLRFRNWEEVKAELEERTASSSRKGPKKTSAESRRKKSRESSGE